MLYIGFEDPTENKLINKIRKTKLKNIDNFVYLNCKLWKTFLNKLVAFIWSIELTVGIENIIITNKPTKNILVKFIIENLAWIFNPSPSDTNSSINGMSKKLDE